MWFVYIPGPSGSHSLLDFTKLSDAKKAYRRYKNLGAKVRLFREFKL